MKTIYHRPKNRNLTSSVKRGFADKFNELDVLARGNVSYTVSDEEKMSRRYETYSWTKKTRDQWNKIVSRIVCDNVPGAIYLGHVTDSSFDYVSVNVESGDVTVSVQPVPVTKGFAIKVTVTNKGSNNEVVVGPYSLTVNAVLTILENSRVPTVIVNTIHKLCKTVK